MEVTYNPGSLLQADKEEFRDFWNSRVGGNTSCLVNVASFAFPIDAALDLTFKVAKILSRYASHLDVAV